MSSTEASELTYVAAERYQVRFELDDEAAAKKVAGGSFVASADAPDPEVSFEISDPPDFVEDSAALTYSPEGLFALITVTLILSPAWISLFKRLTR